MKELNSIIEKCKKGDPAAEQKLFRLFAGKMKAVCIRYSWRKEDAEDIFQEGFAKVYLQINKYRNQGSFEGWMRKIFIRQAINYYHKEKRNQFYELDEEKEIADEIPVEGFESDVPEISMENLLELVNELPEGYRDVFNMYAIDGLTHAEIAKYLNIKPGTSKSQLAKARAFLKRRIKEKFKINHVWQ
jgi:RNA polymerase sigma factor (sigma-70 family)